MERRAAGAAVARAGAEARAWAALRGLTEASVAVLSLVEADDESSESEAVAMSASQAPGFFHSATAEADAVEARRREDAAAAEHCRQRLLAFARHW